MTLSEDKNTVNLSAGSLLSQVLTNVGTIAAAGLLLYGRFVALEVQVNQNTKQIISFHTELDDTRKEFVGEVRQLRLEVTKR